MRPKTNQLGMKPSDLKTMLRRKGFSVDRNPWKNNIVRKGNRIYRLRYWANEFLVDISCLDFDRWANSCEKTITFKEFIQ